MKLAKDNEVILTNTKKNSSKNFSIDASSTFFQIMSSQIYQHKEQATIRELVCNARDSQMQKYRAEGTLTPFKVKFPNKLEPWFSVEDFGVGMSDEVIQEVYSVALKSTKQESDDDIGGFGVGKLAPLSYVDQFQLICRSDGTETLYSVYRQEGQPKVVSIKSSDTDECNGVKVVVPVAEEDFNLFRKEIIKILRWFPQESFVTVGSDSEVKSLIPPEGFTTKGEYGYTFINDNSVSPSNYNNSLIALVGNVAYQCNTSVALSKMCTRNKTLVVELPINSVEVAISRESLSMNKTTKEFIDKVVRGIQDVVVQDLQSVLNSAPTLYCKEVRDNTTLNYVYQDKLRYKGELLAEWYVNYLNLRKIDNLLHLKHTGHVNTRPVKPSCDLHPMNHNICILVVDEKKHLQYNYNKLYSEYPDRNLFRVTEEDLEETKKIFSEFDLTIEYMSKRLANGCKPEKKTKEAKEKVDWTGYRSISLVAGEFRNNFTATCAETLALYDKAISEGQDVYVWTGSFKDDRKVRQVSDISEYLPENTQVFMLNLKVGPWLSKRRKTKPLSDMKFSEKYLESCVESCYRRELREHVNHSDKLFLALLASLSKLDKEFIATCAGEDYDIIHTAWSTKAGCYKSETMAYIFEEIQSLDIKTLADVPDIAIVKESLYERYPLLQNLTGSYNTYNKKETLEEILMYMKLKTKSVTEKSPKESYQKEHNNAA